MLGGTSPQSPSLKLPHFLISYNTRVFENNERYLVSIMVLFMHAVSSTTICIFYAWGIVRTLKMKFLLTTVFAWVQLSDAADWQKAGFSKCSQDNVVREPSNSDWGQRWGRDLEHEQDCQQVRWGRRKRQKRHFRKVPWERHRDAGIPVWLSWLHRRSSLAHRKHYINAGEIPACPRPPIRLMKRRKIQKALGIILSIQAFKVFF